MSLIRWKEARDLPAFPSDVLNIQREINRMFNDFFRSGWAEDSSLVPTAWSPATDITEESDAFVVNVELPGLGKQDVKITMENGTLTIKGEKKQEKESKNPNYHRVERSYGAFQRSFVLPATVVAEKVDASFADGILTVRLPKAEEARAKAVDVKVK